MTAGSWRKALPTASSRNRPTSGPDGSWTGSSPPEGCKAALHGSRSPREGARPAPLELLVLRERGQLEGDPAVGAQRAKMTRPMERLVEPHVVDREGSVTHRWAAPDPRDPESPRARGSAVIAPDPKREARLRERTPPARAADAEVDREMLRRLPSIVDGAGRQRAWCGTELDGTPHGQASRTDQEPGLHHGSANGEGGPGGIRDPLRGESLCRCVASLELLIRRECGEGQGHRAPNLVETHASAEVERLVPVDLVDLQVMTVERKRGEVEGARPQPDPFARRTRDLELEEEVVEPETSVRQLHHVQLDREKLLIGQSPEGGRPTRSGSRGGRESERTGCQDGQNDCRDGASHGRFPHRSRRVASSRSGPSVRKGPTVPFCP